MEFREFNKSVHRYELDHSKPRRKLTCPQCGKDKCFTPYVEIGRASCRERVSSPV